MPDDTITDAQVPALELLLADDARFVLEAAVAPSGGSIVECSIQQVLYRPGRFVTAQFRARVRRPDGSEGRETLVATSGGTIPDGVAVVEGSGIAIGIWAYPADPHLPGLATVSSESGVRKLLAAVGVEGPVVRTRRRAYRPGRRAVVEIVTPNTRLFAKIVRPSRVAPLQAIHRATEGRVPVPRSHGWSPEDGIVLLEAKRGVTLRDDLAKRRRQLPDAADLTGLLDALPGIPEEPPEGSGASPRRTAERHASFLGSLLPDLGDGLDRILSRLPDDPDELPVPVHGDFHSSQVLVRRGTITGLIDVDTLRWGERAEDLGKMLAHLHALRISGKLGTASDAYRAQLTDAFSEVVDPGRLRAYAAASMLGYATGPFRVQESDWRGGITRRVVASEAWIDGTA